ncbi:MAG: hypothetical protein E7388_06720 [Ruminococcaceae bacterium]|nr:hypothetical protein [Oscillospiraceae bacterium]
MGKYDDILHLDRPVSDKYFPMPMADRAAQFSPFAALTGYDEAVSETGRYTEVFCEPDEDVKSQINRKLVEITNRIGSEPKVSIEYFCHDEKKAGGNYVLVCGIVKKISAEKGFLLLDDGKVVDINYIREITIDE